MIISCPNCSTQYDIDDARIPSQGRSLLCAVCATSWFVPAPEPVGNLIRVNNAAAQAKPMAYAAQAQPAQPQETPQQKTHTQTPPQATDDENAASQNETGEADPFAVVDRLGEDRNDAWLKRAKKSADDQDHENSEKPLETKAANTESEAQTSQEQTPKGKKGLFKKKTARTSKQQDDSEQFLAFADHEAPMGVPNDAKMEANPAVVDAEFEDLVQAPTQKHDDGRSSDDEALHASQAVDDKDDIVLSARRDDEDDGTETLETPKMRKGIFLSDDDDDTEDEDEDRPRRLFGRSKKPSTALATTDALDEAAERVFNDEFFKALRVQPKELEKAIRRARRRAEARQKNRLTPLRAFSWTLWLVAIVASLSATYAYRSDIVALWPRANLAYTAVGIEIAPQSLEITRINHRLIMSDEGPQMEVTGVLINKTEKTLAAPLMQAEATSAEGAVLARWTFDVDSEQMIPSEGAAPFKTRAAAPAGVAEITISFAPKNPGPRIGPDMVE